MSAWGSAAIMRGSSPATGTTNREGDGRQSVLGQTVHEVWSHGASEVGEHVLEMLVPIEENQPGATSLTIPRRCMHCGKVVAAQRKELCNHCGLSFGSGVGSTRDRVPAQVDTEGIRDMAGVLKRHVGTVIAINAEKPERLTTMPLVMMTTDSFATSRQGLVFHWLAGPGSRVRCRRLGSASSPLYLSQIVCGAQRFGKSRMVRRPR